MELARGDLQISPMASSSDEQPKPPEPPAAAAVAGTAVATAAAAVPTHAEWAASLQAYYAAAGHPYAWPAQVGFRGIPGWGGGGGKVWWLVFGF